MLKFKGLLEVKENEIIGIASTETPDRDGEVIMQNGWDTTNFNENPVLLASHDYYSFPIGKVIELSIEGTKLLFKAMFSESSPRAREAYQLVKEGILSAFSVGFIPREWDATNNKITKAELLEISLVSVPANPEAVVLAKSLGEKGNSLAKRFSDEWMKVKEIADAVDEKMTEEVEVKEGSKIECECGKTYILKFTTQEEAAPVVEPSKEGEEGNGREEVEEEKALVKGALKLLQNFQEIQNRKEDRK